MVVIVMVGVFFVLGQKIINWYFKLIFMNDEVMIGVMNSINDFVGVSNIIFGSLYIKMNKE